MLLCDIQLAMCLELVFVISTDSLEWSQTVSINRTLIPITYLQCMFTGTTSCCKRYLYEEYLRHRKHAPCFYQVIQTRVEVWENEKCCGNTSRRRGATLKAGMTERRNDGMAESRNGGKYPQILKDGIAESRNGGKYPQILKDGMTENHPKS